MLNFDDDDYSQGYGQNKEALRSQTRNDVPEPFISDNDFRSPKNTNDIEYNVYIFDIRYQKNLESAQPINVEFDISENILAGKKGYA